jgi:hypothetical protein
VLHAAGDKIALSNNPATTALKETVLAEFELQRVSMALGVA